MNTLKKLDWQHAVLIFAMIVTVFGPDLVKVLTDLQMTTAAVTVTKALAVATGFLALLKQFAPSTATSDSNAVNPASKVLALAFVSFLGWTAVGHCQACSPGTTQTAVSAIPAGLTFAVCVIDTYSTDVSQGKDVPTAVADCVVKCGGDGASVVQILDAHKAGEVREGVMAKCVSVDGGK